MAGRPPLDPQQQIIRYTKELAELELERSKQKKCSADLSHKIRMTRKYIRVFKKKV